MSAHLIDAFERRRDARFPLDELRDAYENFKRVSDACASTADYNRFADLFTENCTYVEHVFGEMHGRDAIRVWIVPLMKQHPNDKMIRYTHDWHLFDEENGCIVFSARTHMADPGDGSSHSATNWTRLDYAGDGLFSREEDIYNPANFAKMIKDWQLAKEAARG